MNYFCVSGVWDCMARDVGSRASKGDFLAMELLLLGNVLWMMHRAYPAMSIVYDVWFFNLHYPPLTRIRTYFERRASNTHHCLKLVLIATFNKHLYPKQNKAQVFNFKILY